VPVFAAEVYDQNARLIDAGLTPINLQSVMIGTIVYVLHRLLVIDSILFQGTEKLISRLTRYPIMIYSVRLIPFLLSSASRESLLEKS
jgi:hypothetical protein